MKQYTLQKLTIELVSVLLASLVAFRICEMLSIKLAYLPLVLVGCYIVLKLLYSLSIIMVGYVMKLIPIIYKGEPRPILTTNMGTVEEYGSSEKNNDVLRNAWSFSIMNTKASNKNMQCEKNRKMMRILLRC